MGRTTDRLGWFGRAGRCRAAAAAGGAALAVGAALILPAAAASAGAVVVFDACGGVDHPPFAQPYPGDGASFLLSAFAFDPEVEEATAVVDGQGVFEEVDLTIDDQGLSDLAVGIFSFGDYDVSVFLPEAGGVFSQTVSVGPDDVPCDSTMLTPAPQETAPPTPSETETAQESPTPTEAPSETETPTPADTVQPTPSGMMTDDAPATTDEGGFPWPLLIVGGGILVLVGWFIAKAEEDCPEEMAALAAAREACEEAREAARAARDHAEEQQAEADEVRERLDDVRETFPDAGKPGGDSWVESEGVRITSMDVRMKRAAMKAAWQHYASNPGPQTAQETMEMWEEFDTPEFRERLREIDEQARELAGELAREQAEADAADAAADQAEQAADAACARVRAAEQALADCLKAKNPPPTPPTGGTTGGTTTGGGTPGTTTGGGEGGGEDEEEERCEEGAQELRNITARRFTVPIGNAFQISGGHAHADAERARGTAAELKDIGSALGWVSTAMTATSGATAMWRASDGWEVAKEVVWSGGNIAVNQTTARLDGSRGIGVPLPTNPIQAGIDTLSLTATLTGHLLEAFAGLHERRLNDVDCREGTRMETYTLRCANLWVCEGGQWVDKGKVFTSTRGRTFSTRGKWHPAITWPQLQAILERWAARTARRQRSVLEEMDSFRRQCTGS